MFNINFALKQTTTEDVYQSVVISQSIDEMINVFNLLSINKLRCQIENTAMYMHTQKLNVVNFFYFHSMKSQFTDKLFGMFPNNFYIFR